MFLLCFSMKFILISLSPPFSNNSYVFPSLIAIRLMGFVIVQFTMDVYSLKITFFLGSSSYDYDAG